VTDDHLDRLLEAWARDRRLPVAEADRIRLAITTTAPALDAAWWCDLADRVSSTMVRAATMSEAARGAVDQALRPRLIPQPW
jgi:hypothetical protein